MSKDSAENDQILSELLDYQLLDGTVKENVLLNYYPLPQPHHPHSFAVTQLIPFLKVLCSDKGICLLEEYKDFCFNKVESVSEMRDISEIAFKQFWASEVSAEFGLNLSEITSMY